jgi:hypothetical protein
MTARLVAVRLLYIASIRRTPMDLFPVGDLVVSAFPETLSGADTGDGLTVSTSLAGP